jgi:MinD-like ATPase involved in chromosome partitioning or flagellar assembly
METITFYSYKGGVGRTLALANVAHYLALLGKKVVAVDFDLEAPGLHYKLVHDPDARNSIKYGLVDYISETLAGGSRASSLDKYAFSVPLPYGGEGSLHIIPAGSAPNPSYWETLAGIDWQDMLYGGSARGAIIFLELKALIETTLRPDFLLIDARTGITEIGGVATAIMADKIVCMLTTNPENMEGARVVLRGMTHAPRPEDSNEVQVFPVISRLHVSGAKETRLVEQALGYLNEPAEDLRSTLSFSHITVLHNDDDIASQEKILVGGEGKVAQSPLLRDYLSLFARLSADTIKESTTPIIRRAMLKLLDRPDEAQQEIENLAFSFNAAEAYRELLKIYRLRNIHNDKAIMAAQSLWYFRQPEDVGLVSETIRSCFKEIYPWNSPSKEYSLDFIEEVWSRSESSSPKLAIDLAESLDNFSERQKAANVLRRTYSQFPKDDNVLLALITQLSRDDQYKEVRSIVESNLDRVINNQELLAQWARIEGRPGNADIPEALRRDDIFALLSDKAAPAILINLLRASGRHSELNEKAVELLRSAASNNDVEGIFAAAEIVIKSGRRRDFSEVLSTYLDASTIRRIETAVLEGDEEMMPSSYEMETRARIPSRYR